MLLSVISVFSNLRTIFTPLNVLFSHAGINQMCCISIGYRLIWGAERRSPIGILGKNQQSSGTGLTTVLQRNDLLDYYELLFLMGVNHGGDESPQNLQWGDANTGCRPDFCHFSKFQSLAMDSSPQISTQIYATAFPQH
jgi:hypothetical protein